MQSINISILGDYSIASKFGKKGTSSDITLYDRKISDKIFTWILPTSFPDKIQSLIQSIYISDYSVIYVNKLDKYFAEQIIALDSLGINNGYLLHSYDIDRNKIKSLINDTIISNFKILENIEDLQREFYKLPEKTSTGPLVIPIDHSFDVKGVGTVVLGVIKTGKIRQYDKIKIFPQNKELLVKSIQIHDDPVDEAICPSRVGLSIKGISHDEINRGDILCNNQDIKISTSEIKVETFKKNRYMKNDITEKQTYLLSIGLQIKPTKVIFENSLSKLLLEKSMAYTSKQKFLLLSPENQGTRIIGDGILK
ncbi:MAG: EF-Tu/IF-2/RF-3 family GTPase [Nitrososphaeraceae archaeon]